MTDFASPNVGARFSVGRYLGSGAFGIVYEAYDAQRECFVALKTLKHVTAENLYRLKHEFRSLADLRHRNLVEFHELHCVDGTWFITMELIDGVSFLRWVRPSADAKAGVDAVTPADDVDVEETVDATPHTAPRDPVVDGAVLNAIRLRSALRQLWDGVSAIHSAGKLHRDLKPSNVLVTAEGRVVLLDFGLAAELAPRDDALSLEFAGTPAFMAPELTSGGRASPAADWYSVGVMLCQALTGRLPFYGSVLDMLALKMRFGARDLPELAASEPQDLARLCLALLNPDPASRPTNPDALGLSFADAEPTSWSPAVEAHEFIGRAAELSLLRRGLHQVAHGQTTVVRLQGESGMGKTALVDAFLKRAASARGAVVLQGRCYVRESVPFKALDGVVDALSRFLKRQPQSEAAGLLPRDAHALSRLFPVLQRVDAVAHAPRRPLDRDPVELRRAGLASLRELLARIADRRLLLVHVDDAQWGDLDSAQALLEMLRPPDQPRLMLIVSSRPESDNGSFLEVFKRQLNESAGVTIVDIELRELDEESAIDLATRLLPHVKGVQPAVVAREAGGNPFLIAEFVRELLSGGADAASSFATLVAHRVGRLSGEARRILEIAAIAGQPTPVDTIRKTAELTRLDSRVIDELSSAHLARTTQTRGAPALTCYHDRIREAVLSLMTPDAVAARHLDLAEALEAAGGPADALALHFQAAGHLDRAAEYALQAADRASDALAFDRAVRLYRLVLSLIADSDSEKLRAVLTRLGDALANAGLGYEAAQAYLRADDLASGNDQLDLRRRAVHQLLSAGHIDEGLALVRRLLRAIDMRWPETQAATLLTLASLRIALRIRGTRSRHTNGSDLRQAGLVRLDTCFSIGIGLSTVDTLRGAVFQTRHTLLALRIGEPSRVARALAMEAGFLSIEGPRTHRAVAQLLQRARRLAAELDEPYAHAMCLLVGGIASCESAEWRRGLVSCDEATAALRLCPGVRWEQVTAHLFALFSLFNLGEWQEYMRRSRALVDDARQRGDLYAETSLALMSYTMDLAADDSTAAASRTIDSGARWPSSTFDVQQFWQSYALCEIDLYRGNGITAYGRLREFWPALRHSLLTRVHVLHVFALYLRGRCAVAAAAEGERPALTIAKDAARRIDRQRAAWARPFSDIIRAGVAGVEGYDEAVRARLGSARVGLVVSEMLPWHTAVSYCIRRRQRDEAPEPSAAWFEEQGVRRPERFSAMLVPGV